MTNHTGSVNGSSPADCSCSIWNTRAWPHLRIVYPRMTTRPVSGMSGRYSAVVQRDEVEHCVAAIGRDCCLDEPIGA
jgi:hypothetical protein